MVAQNGAVAAKGAMGSSRSTCTKPASLGAICRDLSTAAQLAISVVPRCKCTGSRSHSGASA